MTQEQIEETYILTVKTDFDAVSQSIYTLYFLISDRVVVRLKVFMGRIRPEPLVAPGFSSRARKWQLSTSTSCCARNFFRVVLIPDTLEGDIHVKTTVSNCSINFCIPEEVPTATRILPTSRICLKTSPGLGSPRPPYQSTRGDSRTVVDSRY